MGDVNHTTVRKKLTKKTGLPRHVKDMSKEQLEAAIKKKRECNAKALGIVEQMLESHISEDWFLEQLKFIDVGHFQDIIEERALCKLCGYPLCAENLKTFPNQQFRISTKYNKVYDITERKNFCSNQCYKASRYVKDQLLTSPLWLRDKEDIPSFKLLPLGSKGTGAGEEVDLGQNNSLKSEVTKINKDERFISVADYTQGSISQLSKKINDMEIKESTKSADRDVDNSSQNTKNGSCNTKNNVPASNMEGLENEEEKNTRLENLVGTHEKLEKRDQNICKNDQKKVLKSNLKHVLPVENSASKENSTKNSERRSNDLCGEAKGDRKNEMCDQVKCEKNSVCQDVASSIIYIEKCVHDWFTIDTMCYLFGEQKVKDLVCDKGECIKEYYKAVGKTAWDPLLQVRYEALCRKLNLMEIQEEHYDKEERELKPLPDYSVLKEEAMKMNIKIQAFYEGKCDYEMHANTNKDDSQTYTPSCVLPLVDIHAQNALRRRMVLDNLKRVLPDLLSTFGLSSRDISSEVRYLVSSFTLSAHNITFSPAEWNLMGLIIIKMLSIKDIRLKMVLETSQGIKYQTMLLMSFQQDGGYLDRLMIWLTDIDNIMKKP